MSPSIYPFDVGARRLARNELVREEIVLKAFDEHRWNIFNVTRFTPDVVVFQHADDFIVSIPAINHLQSPNHSGAHDDFITGYGALAENADIQGITVTFLSRGRELLNT